jgi:hypothetical protein
MIGIPFTSVWGTKMRLTLGIAALAATMAAATPAAAQVASVADAEARGLVLTAESFAKDRDLDFGAVTVDPTSTGGTVSIAATEGLGRTVTGGVSTLAGAAQSAKFIGYGAPGQIISLVLTQPSGGVLQGPGTNTIPATLVLDAGGTNRTVGSSATFEAFVGGTFTIDETQVSGLYSGDFTLTANYP